MILLWIVDIAKFLYDRVHKRSKNNDILGRGKIKLYQIKRHLGRFRSRISTVIVGTFVHSRLNFQRQPFHDSVLKL